MQKEMEKNTIRRVGELVAMELEESLEGGEVMEAPTREEVAEHPILTQTNREVENELRQELLRQISQLQETVVEEPRRFR